MNKKYAFILTCEHAGKDIPVQYQHLFTDAEEILDSHYGWDPGAYDLVKIVAEQIRIELFSYHFTRLLIEPNRSLDHPKLFSTFSSCLSDAEKKTLVERYYFPYREKVESRIAALISEDFSVVHLSFHSFTPVWNGQKREVEIGLLFDPDRIFENVIINKWEQKLLTSSYLVRRNEPYLGIDDGFTTYLRERFSASQYAGIELEVSQTLLKEDFDDVSKLILESVKELCQITEDNAGH